MGQTCAANSTKTHINRWLIFIMIVGIPFKILVKSNIQQFMVFNNNKKMYLVLFPFFLITQFSHLVAISFLISLKMNKLNVLFYTLNTSPCKNIPSVVFPRSCGELLFLLSSDSIKVVNIKTCSPTNVSSLCSPFVWIIFFLPTAPFCFK